MAWILLWYFWTRILNALSSPDKTLRINWTSFSFSTSSSLWVGIFFRISEVLVRFKLKFLRRTRPDAMCIALQIWNSHYVIIIQPISQRNFWLKLNFAGCQRLVGWITDYRGRRGLTRILRDFFALKGDLEKVGSLEVLPSKGGIYFSARRIQAQTRCIQGGRSTKIFGRFLLMFPRRVAKPPHKIIACMVSFLILWERGAKSPHAS